MIAECDGVVADRVHLRRDRVDRTRFGDRLDRRVVETERGALDRVARIEEQRVLATPLRTDLVHDARDAGDTIQGTPLGFYYATVEPVTETGAIHPMAAQMNAIGYDAVALGNHEFNYGLDFLDNWISQMDADVLAANAVHAGTKVPAYLPYTIKT